MIQFTAMPALKKVLAAKNIRMHQYGPAYGESAGLDLYYVGDLPLYIPPVIPEIRDPKINHQYIQQDLREDRFAVVIPTGLKVALASDRVGIVFERFSITKSPLKVRAGIIDCGFTGEIQVNAVNLSQYDYVIQPGAKIPFQLVVTTVDTHYRYVDEETYADWTKHSRRKEACNASSDEKEVLFTDPASVPRAVSS